MSKEKGCGKMNGNQTKIKQKIDEKTIQTKNKCVNDESKYTQPAKNLMKEGDKMGREQRIQRRNFAELRSYGTSTNVLKNLHSNFFKTEF